MPWRSRDPIPRLHARLLAGGEIATPLEAWIDEAKATVDLAELFARNSPLPRLEAAVTDVYGTR